jgi:hypothetical protein
MVGCRDNEFQNSFTIENGQYWTVWTVFFTDTTISIYRLMKGSDWEAFQWMVLILLPVLSSHGGGGRSCSQLHPVHACRSNELIFRDQRPYPDIDSVVGNNFNNSEIDSVVSMSQKDDHLPLLNSSGDLLCCLRC